MQAIRNLIDCAKELRLLTQSFEQPMTGEVALRCLARITPVIEAMDDLGVEAEEDVEAMTRERFSDHCLAWERDE